MSEPDQITTAPEDTRPVRWGLGDAAVGWFVALLGGAIGVSLVVVLSGVDSSDTDDLSLGWIAAAQLGLWFGLLGAPWFAARTKGNGMVRDFGLRGRPWDSLTGLGVGVVSQVLLLPILYLPIRLIFDTSQSDIEEAAKQLTDRATDPVGVILLVLIVGVGAPIVEEIFYRGLLFRSIEKRFGVWPAIIGSGVIFGAAHFQVLQFAGLAVFGVILAYLTHRTGRLVPAIFAHVAFNMVTVVFLVFD